MISIPLPSEIITRTFFAITASRLSGRSSAPSRAFSSWVEMRMPSWLMFLFYVQRTMAGQARTGAAIRRGPRL